MLHALTLLPPLLALCQAPPGDEIVVARRSSEIRSSPFATLDSFEVHGEQDDPGVIESMARLGVKHVVMHNIHMCLPDPADRRLNAWIDGCAREGIEVRCILYNRDPEFWRTALRNYGDRIKHWSYLNEPNGPDENNDHSKPVVRPEVYVSEIAAVRKVMHEERPDCRLYGPELAMVQHIEEYPWPWVRLAIEAGLLNWIDGFSIHPYRQGYSPSNVPENPSTFGGEPTDRYTTYEEQIATLREMTRHKPIVVNEVGWSTTPVGPITELTQAKFALRQEIQDFALGMECATYFMIRERYPDAPFPAGHFENHTGITRTDNTPKPAYLSLQALYSQLDDDCTRAYPAATFGRDGVKWYVFDNHAGAVPVRMLFYWLPLPARDDFPTEAVDVNVGDLALAGLPISESPRMLRLTLEDGKWGRPVLVNLVARDVEHPAAT